MTNIFNWFRPKLKIEMLHDPELLQPTKANKHDACYDIKCPTNYSFTGSGFIPLGFKAEVPKGYCLYILPKSGLAKEFGFTLVNSPGIVDSGYKDEVGLTVITKRPVYFKRGEKIAQMMLRKLVGEKLEIVDKISGKGNRGGGFGSTGRF